MWWVWIVFTKFLLIFLQSRWKSVDFLEMVSLVFNCEINPSRTVVEWISVSSCGRFLVCCKIPSWFCPVHKVISDLGRLKACLSIQFISSPGMSSKEREVRAQSEVRWSLNADSKACYFCDFVRLFPIFKITVFCVTDSRHSSNTKGTY